MDVIALVGPSGTGKSHRALIVAHEHRADAIIDDGLFIMHSKIIAGYSAKKELSKLKAIKRAIFLDPEHAREVREAVARVAPKRILILGTSEGMAVKIAEVLQFPPISKFIHIEEIATQAEISKARESRVKNGRHIIPVPTIELKPHFTGYLIDPLEIFFRKPVSKKKHKLGEKSIVRPRFSYYGKLLISDAAIASIVHHVATGNPWITGTRQILTKNLQDSEKGISISLDVTLKYGQPIISVVQDAQLQIKNMVEYMTGMVVNEVNIQVKSLIIANE